MSLGHAVRIGSAAVLAVLALAACGGGSPDDASAGEFCDAWSDRGGTVEDVHEAAETLEDVGTPEDIDDAARDGFEVFVEVLADVDQDDLEAMDQVAADETGLADTYGIDKDEAADVLALFEYANASCSDSE